MHITHAMLLAAGLGERLRPLTSQTPKPLLTIGGKPLIEYHLERLSAAGIRHVVINVSYLATHIIDHLGDGERWNLQITYSYEKTPLGAAGGVRQALPFLGEKPFLLISSDIYTSFSFEKFFAPTWQLHDNLLHCVVSKKSSYDTGDFGLDHHLLTSPLNPPYSFGSIAIVHPNVFSRLPQGKSSLLTAFTHVIDLKKATGELSDQIHNVNTVEEYQQLQFFK